MCPRQTENGLVISRQPKGGGTVLKSRLIGVSFIPKTEARYKGSWPKVCWSGGSFVFFRFTLTCEPVAVWPAMMS